MDSTILKNLFIALERSYLEFSNVWFPRHFNDRSLNWGVQKISTKLK